MSDEPEAREPDAFDDMIRALTERWQLPPGWWDGDNPLPWTVADTPHVVEADA